MNSKKFEIKINGQKIKLQEGLHLVDPSHGIGIVQSVESQEVFGEEVVLCSILFLNENLKLLIPVNKMKDMGIRTLSSKDIVQKIVSNVLSKSAKCNRGVWTKRIVEYETKFFSGSVVLIAEVVRDLFQSTYDSTRSYGERMLFEKAMYRLCNEFSLVLGVPYEEAYRTVYDALMISAPVIKDETVEELDDVDGGDFDDDDEDADDDNVAVA
ncbi:MAG: hypothetical protein RL208_272 [Pseudomonadota bacterium]|jgi:CarD family transcriptional regulator